MDALADGSVNLIVTSPPYPMIEMWDPVFSTLDDGIRHSLESNNARAAFDRMHAVLNAIWQECDRVLADGGFICINIGDATRTIDGVFQLFPNHAAVISRFSSMGYSVLPDILWRKPSNAPTKFMGSGMYPAGAYVTYEHEYILIFRKGAKRSFHNDTKKLRRESAYFWEERNVWFSDLWEIKGTTQGIDESTSRERSAAFPLEIPYRLVNMYSIKNDTVLDPFSGLGTTTLACMAAQRHSVGVEIDPSIQAHAFRTIGKVWPGLNTLIQKRLDQHEAFIRSFSVEQTTRCYLNGPHQFNVKTRQEMDLSILSINSVTRQDSAFICDYGRPFRQLALPDCP